MFVSFSSLRVCLFLVVLSFSLCSLFLSVFLSFLDVVLFFFVSVPLFFSLFVFLSVCFSLSLSVFVWFYYHIA